MYWVGRVFMVVYGIENWDECFINECVFGFMLN